MGTRGFVGFVIDGVEKITYNHFDSYPDGLGKNVLDWIRDVYHDGVLDEVIRRARELRVVSENSEPTDEDIEHLGIYLNMGVGEHRERPNWYQLLRETQGDLAAVLNAGVMIDSSDFPLDSLFAEWGYLVDFDNSTFEVYEGFQRNQHHHGRFAHRQAQRTEYYPCALFTSWPFSALPSDDEFERTFGGDEE